MTHDLNIVIMCGGRGRRMGKLTNELPKPLVPFRGETILDMKIQDYLRRGYRDIVLAIGHKGDLIRRAAERYQGEGNLSFSDAGEDAGILQRLWHARDLWGARALMTYGDTFTDLDLRDLEAVHEAGGRKATIVTAPIENPFGLVEFDHQRNVTLFREKPVLNYYIGQAMIDRGALSLISDEIVHMSDGRGLVTLFKVLIAVDALGAYPHQGLEITFNTQEDLAEMEQKLGRFYTAREGRSAR